MGAGLSLFLQVLPLAIGAAITPTFLAAQLLLLAGGTPAALRRGWALAAGSMTMLLLISIASASLLIQLPDFGTGRASWVGVAIFAVGGTALLAVATFVARRPRNESGESSLAKLAQARPVVIFGVAAARLASNASTLALYLPALHLIGRSTADTPAKAVVFVMLFVITEAAVLIPVLAVTVLGERAGPMLRRIHEGLARRSRPLTVGVCCLFGVGLLILAGRDVLALV